MSGEKILSEHPGVMVLPRGKQIQNSSASKIMKSTRCYFNTRQQLSGFFDLSRLKPGLCSCSVNGRGPHSSSKGGIVCKQTSLKGDIGVIFGDNGKENGNYYGILGLYGDNGKENGNYYLMAFMASTDV